jgi:hypothetical protein
MRVVPYIDGRVCGEELFSDAAARDHDGLKLYHVVVDPEELVAGCGREGAVVQFVLQVEGQPDVDLGAESWLPNPEEGFERAEIDVTGQVATRPTP